MSLRLARGPASMRLYLGPYELQSHGHNDGEGVTHERAANGHQEKQGDDESADSQDEDDELLISTQR